MQTLADIEDAILILLRLRIQLAEMFVGKWTLEVIGILLTLLLRTQHQTDLLDATLHQLLQKDQDHGTHHPIRTRDGKEILLQGTRGRIKPGAETCHRDNGATHRVNRLQCERISLHATIIEIGNQLLLSLSIASQELNRAVTMRADTLATPYERLDVRILKYTVELGRPEGRRHRHHLLIEERFRLCHQPSQRLCIPLRHILDGTMDDIEVLLSESLVLSTVCIGRREGIGLVQVGEDLDGVLLGTEIGKDPIEMCLHIERTHLNLIAVEGHQIRLHAKGTSLIQTSTAATGPQLPHIGDVHLAKSVQVQII